VEKRGRDTNQKGEKAKVWVANWRRTVNAVHGDSKKKRGGRKEKKGAQHRGGKTQGSNKKVEVSVKKKKNGVGRVPTEL